MKHNPIFGQLDPDSFEPSWVFSTAEIYVDMDLGRNHSVHSLSEGDMPQKFRRPWFKLNYSLPSTNSLRLYKRPYFHIAEE